MAEEGGSFERVAVGPMVVVAGCWLGQAIEIGVEVWTLGWSISWHRFLPCQ